MGELVHRWSADVDAVALEGVVEEGVLHDGVLVSSARDRAARDRATAAALAAYLQDARPAEQRRVDVRL